MIGATHWLNEPEYGLSHFTNDFGNDVANPIRFFSASFDSPELNPPLNDSKLRTPNPKATHRIARTID